MARLLNHKSAIVAMVLGTFEAFRAARAANVNVTAGATLSHRASMITLNWGAT